jgi:hypothetical protein
MHAGYGDLTVTDTSTAALRFMALIKPAVSASQSFYV